MQLTFATPSLDRPGALALGVAEGSDLTGSAADLVRTDAERVAREADGLKNQVVDFVGGIAAA